FIANMGQSDAEVAFHAPSSGAGLFFTPDEVVFSLPMPEDQTFVTRMAFVGAETTHVTGYSPQEGVFNFFLGNDPDQWHTNVPTYAGIRYHNLYPGIDLRFEGTQGVLKSTYAVTPGADPSMIAYRYAGAEQVTVDPATGDLRILLYTHAEYGDMTIAESAPLAWQTIEGAQVPVDVRFMLTAAGHIGFELADYNPAHELIIDPSVQYSTYFGGFFDEIGYDIVMDDSGNGYLTGRTASSNMPDTDNALQGDINGTSDAFIAKLNVSISAQRLVYGTYLGGGQAEEAHGIAIDAAGNMYITGKTTSTDFPTTATPYQADYGGGGDAFVAKISADGSTLMYGTYLGGNTEDLGRAIALDTSGNAYITGFTTSINFPNVNEIQSTLSGAQDAFVTKLTGDGSGALYSTYLGGAGTDDGLDIDIDAANQPTIVGYTDSLDFPTHVGGGLTVFQAANAGGTDGFVTKLLVDGSGYFFSTYFGGSATDQVTGIVIEDATGIAFITGWTTSTSGDFPVTFDALQAENAGAEDAFIASLNATGNTLLYSTFIGGSTMDKAADITQDPQGIVHIAGETRSPNLIPVSAPTLPPVPVPPGVDIGITEYTFDTYHGGLDAFVMALDLSTNTYFYAAYIGGFDDPGDLYDVPDDRALAMAVDTSGGIYIAGETFSVNFPLANAAYQRGGNGDAFVVKIGSAQADLVINKTADVPEVLVGEDVTYTIEVTNDGPSATHNVVIEDTVPVEAEVQSIVTTGTCTQVGQFITCELGTLAADETTTVTVVVTAIAKGIVENTAQITESSDFDPDTSAASNSSTATVLYYKDADLTIDVSANTHRPTPNQTIDLVIEVTNLGLAPDANVVVTDSLPAEVTYVADDSGGSYNLLTGTWTIGAMARDQVATLTITVTVNDLAIGTEIAYPASVTGIENDPDPLNNADTAELVVVGESFPPYGCFPSVDEPDVIICITGTGG
ncbi:MAG: DUF11 domain-containing protein, partial [Actinomycetia bacterium]|nr:DUF11 domain-containing protein [Actinomycetes bacterium]